MSFAFPFAFGKDRPQETEIEPGSSDHLD
jgi:hypothetical protein